MGSGIRIGWRVRELVPERWPVDRRDVCKTPAMLLEFDAWVVLYERLGPRCPARQISLECSGTLQYGRGGINTSGCAGEMSRQDPLSRSKALGGVPNTSTESRPVEGGGAW